MAKVYSRKAFMHRWCCQRVGKITVQRDIISTGATTSVAHLNFMTLFKAKVLVTSSSSSEAWINFCFFFLVKNVFLAKTQEKLLYFSPPSIPRSLLPTRFVYHFIKIHPVSLHIFHCMEKMFSRSLLFSFR